MVALAFGDLGLGATEKAPLYINLPPTAVGLPFRVVPGVPAGFVRPPQGSFTYNPNTLEKCLLHPETGKLVVIKMNEKFWRGKDGKWTIGRMDPKEFERYKEDLAGQGKWSSNQQKLASSAAFWSAVPFTSPAVPKKPAPAAGKKAPLYINLPPSAVGLPFKVVSGNPSGFVKPGQGQTFTYNPKTLEKCLKHPATGKLVVIKMNEKFWRGKDGKWTVGKMVPKEFERYKEDLVKLNKWGAEQEKLARSRAFWDVVGKAVEPLIRMTEATKNQAIALIGKLFPQVSSQVAKREAESKKAYAAISAMPNGPAKAKLLADWKETERRWDAQGAKLWATAQKTMNDPEQGKKVLPPLDPQKKAVPAPTAKGVVKKVVPKLPAKKAASKLPARKSVPKLSAKTVAKKASTLRGYESAEFGNEFGIVPVVAVVAVIGIGAISLIKVLYEVSKLSSAAMLAANSLRVNAETNRATAIASGHVIQFADGRVAALTPTGQVVPVNQIEAILPPPPKEGTVTGNSIRLPDGRIVVPELVTSSTGVSTVTNVPTVPVSSANDPIEREIQQSVGRTVPSVTYPSQSSGGGMAPIPVGADVSMPGGGGEPLQSGFGGPAGFILLAALGAGAFMLYKKGSPGKLNEKSKEEPEESYEEGDRYGV
jgi:hypothetical protein